MNLIYFNGSECLFETNSETLRCGSVQYGVCTGASEKGASVKYHQYGVHSHGVERNRNLRK